MTTCQDPPSAQPVTGPPRALSAATFVSSFDRFVISPMLVLIASGLGVPLSTVVVTASGYFLAYGLSQPLWGVLSDRFGRVRVIRATLLAAALAGAVSAAAPGLVSLAASRIVAGAFFGAVVPTSLTYVGDTVTAGRRQRALSDLMAAMATGTALATAFGGVLAHLLDWRAVFATSAACAALCAFAMRALPEPPRAPVAGVGRHLGTVLRDRWALLVFGLAFVEGAVLLGTMTLLAAALQANGVSAAVAGLATAAFGVGVLGFSLLVKRLAGRMPVWSLIAVGGAQICLGYGIVAGRIGLATVVVTALLLGGGWSFMHSSLQTWATSVAPQARGTAVAFFAAALFIGSSVAVTAAGPLAQHDRFALLFGIACALSVPLTLTAVLCRRRWPGATS
ncbi:permease [Streptomyces abyssalis]|uniref:Permease n=2 Tax=Streptomyces abyssalis TaxID=933944 RepID=A0A1E7JR02_9ACTN|nr:permease [Streptomyces abyssalis]OEU90686.1 permease [Streptomyces abyssalis]